MKSSHVVIVINFATQVVRFIEADSFAVDLNQYAAPDTMVGVCLMDGVDEAVKDMMWTWYNPPAMLDEDDYEATYPMRGGHAAYDA